jgi:class 3 adenylate cyclase/TolB-like protein
VKSERVLATVLFTDIVGSTERAAELGDRAWRELLARHHALVRRELRRFGGRELTVSGDGFLATFERPEPAIRCACAVRDGVRELGLEIRSGLHAGEVEVGEGTVGGIAVHTGARVAALAGPGEVLVSAALRDFVAGSGFTFEERGVHTLKGVPGEWRLFAVTDQPLRLPMGEVGERVREARLAPVVLGYLAVAMIVLWLTGYLQGRFGLPGWTLGAAVVLLAIGLLSVTATAWVQARTRRAAAGGVSTPVEQSLPGAWQIAPRELGRSLARGRLPHLTWGRSLLGGAVAFSLLFGLAGLYVIVRDRGRTFAPAEAVAEAAGPGIAVLPFTVRGDGLDVWREGMVDVISTNLDGAAGMRSIDSRTVLARWDEVAEGSGRADLATSLEAARRAEARYAVVGSAIATGPDVRLAAEIYDVASRRRLGQGQAVGAPDSILPLVNQLSIEVLRALLQGTDADVPWLEVATLTTSSVAALKPYLEGEALYRRSDFAGAVAAYQRALEADSTFALALIASGTPTAGSRPRRASWRTTSRRAPLARRIGSPSARRCCCAGCWRSTAASSPRSRSCRARSAGIRTTPKRGFSWETPTTTWEPPPWSIGGRKAGARSRTRSGSIPASPRTTSI